MWSAGGRSGGRTGVGASNHCAHGDRVSVETILDWRPFDYFTTETIAKGQPRLFETMELQVGDGGVVVVADRLQAAMGMPRWLRRAVCRLIFGGYYRLPEMYRDMARLIETEQVEVEAPGAAGEEGAGPVAATAT